jgi:hypothetical protein
LTDNRGLHVEMRDGEILVTLPHTRFAVSYYKLANDPQRYLNIQSFPTRQDRAVGMTAEEFLAKAWKLAHRKARELGWIV